VKSGLLLALVLAVAGPMASAAGPSPVEASGETRRTDGMPALVETRECARLEPPISCVLLMGRTSDGGGASRLLAVIAAATADGAPRRFRSSARLSRRTVASRPPAPPSLGRAPPAAATL
jgi:hypothetical protein